MKLACKEIGENPRIRKGYNRLHENLLGLIFLTSRPLLIHYSALFRDRHCNSRL